MIAEQWCPRSRGWLESPDGDVIRAGCQAYACEVCGPRKARRLGRAIAEWIRTHCAGGATFWTFTLTSRHSSSIDEHRQQFSRAWHYFWREIRRTLLLSPRQRAAQYVYVVEAHRSGYVHRHALMSCFMPWRLIQPIWESACRHALGIQGTDEHVGFCFVRFVPPDDRSVVRYVVKYITKSAAVMRDHMSRGRVWSRSRGVVLQLRPQRDPSRRWTFTLDLRSLTCPDIPDLVSTTPDTPSPPI